MTTATEVKGFLAKYTPALAKQLSAARRKLRAQIPRGYELVYDYNHALLFAFSATEKGYEAPVSVGAYPEGVKLFFLWKKLKDPHNLLEGKGALARGVLLKSPSDLDSAPIRALLEQALNAVAKEFAAAPKLKTVIKKR